MNAPINPEFLRNPHTRDLYETAKAEFDLTETRMKLSKWLAEKTKIKGRPFNTDRYPFQEALIDDESRESVTIKPSQVGVSEIYQRVALAMLARANHRKGIYAYPNDDMRKKNSQTRVQPMVEDTPALNMGLFDKPIRSVALMQIAQSFLYMTGNKVEDATSTDADFVFLDEYDLHDMSNAALFLSRTLNSDWRIHRWFSTPTYLAFGVHKLFGTSDKHHYMVKCPSCNHWQYPMFEPKFIHMPGLPSDFNNLLDLDETNVEHFNIQYRKSYVCCERCRSRLDLMSKNLRSWVPERPSAELRGWRVNPFSTSMRHPGDIVNELFKYKQNNNIRGFKNSVLGEPEDAGSNQISEGDIQACMGNAAIPMDQQIPHWLGIDLGQTCHLILGRGYDLKRMQFIRMEQIPIQRIAEVVAEIRERYWLVGGACDRHPETVVADNIREASGGVVYPCEYRGLKEVNIINAVDDANTVSHIQVNRTQMIDRAAKMVRTKAVQFNGYGILQPEISVQYRNMVREEEPEKEATWRKLDENDHFFHAHTFLCAGVRAHDVIEASIGVPQSVIMVAGANMGGYTPSLFGAPAPSSQQRMTPPWLRR